jgi:hypothetical protein
MATGQDKVAKLTRDLRMMKDKCEDLNQALIKNEEQLLKVENVPFHSLK